MSKTQQMHGSMPAPGCLALSQVAGYLAAIATTWIASIIVWRIERRAYRELAALDDRTLKDMGVARSELLSLVAAFAETRTASALSQLPWNHPRMGA